LHAEYIRAKGDPLERVTILGRMGRAAATPEQKRKVKILAAYNAIDVKFETRSQAVVAGRTSLDPWHYVGPMGPGRKGFLERMWEYQIESGHAMFGIPVEAVAENMDHNLALFRLLDGSERLAVLHDIMGDVVRELNDLESWVKSNRPELRVVFQAFIQAGKKLRKPTVDVYKDEQDWIARRWRKDYTERYG
jgi:hypothetical protein